MLVTELKNDISNYGRNYKQIDDPKITVLHCFYQTVLDSTTQRLNSLDFEAPEETQGPKLTFLFLQSSSTIGAPVSGLSETLLLVFLLLRPLGPV